MCTVLLVTNAAYNLTTPNTSATYHSKLNLAVPCWQQASCSLHRLCCRTTLPSSLATQSAYHTSKLVEKVSPPLPCPKTTGSTVMQQSICVVGRGGNKWDSPAGCLMFSLFKRVSITGTTNVLGNSFTLCTIAFLPCRCKHTFCSVHCHACNCASSSAACKR